MDNFIAQAIGFGVGIIILASAITLFVRLFIWLIQYTEFMDEEIKKQKKKGQENE